MNEAITDPMEKLVATALDAAGLPYVSDMEGNPSGLDFRLSNGVEIEVKRMHSPRIADQMARAENVIVAQGIEAVQFLADLINGYAFAKYEQSLPTVARHLGDVAATQDNRPPK